MSVPRPIFDRVIVKPLPPPEMTKGGLHIAGSSADRMEDATVIRSGCDVIKDGEVVTYPAHLGVKQTYGDVEYKLMNASEVWAIVVEADGTSNI